MAKRFRFRLEGVRRVRTQQCDAQRREVADAARAVTSAQVLVDQLGGGLRAAVQQARSEQQERRLDVMSLRIHRSCRNHLQRRILDSQETLAGKQRELDVARQGLADASKRLKVIETLREKQWSRHRWETNREEQAAGDEVAVQRYVRRGDEPGREDTT